MDVEEYESELEYDTIGTKSARCYRKSVFENNIQGVSKVSEISAGKILIEI